MLFTVLLITVTLISLPMATLSDAEDMEQGIALKDITQRVYANFSDCFSIAPDTARNNLKHDKYLE